MWNAARHGVSLRASAVARRRYCAAPAPKQNSASSTANSSVPSVPKSSPPLPPNPPNTPRQKPDYSRYRVNKDSKAGQKHGENPGRSGDGGGGSNSNSGDVWQKFMPAVYGGGLATAAVSYMVFSLLGGSRDGPESGALGTNGSMTDTASRGADTSSGMPARGGHMPPSSGPVQEVSWKYFKDEVLSQGIVSKIEVVNGSLAVVYYLSDPNRPRLRFNIGSIETFERNLEQAQEDIGTIPSMFVPVVYVDETSFSRVLVDWIPTVLFIAAYAFIARRMSGGMPGGPPGPTSASKKGRPGNAPGGMNPFGGGTMGGMGGGPGGPGGIFNVGKAKATLYSPEDNKVTVKFSDVAGLDEAKQEIMEFVQYLKKPEKYKELGAKIPKGALMHGPPGTGKTLLAKATAGEAGVPFLTMSGSDFMEMYVGVGPSRVRDLFTQARGMTPCIVFIDEIDAIGRKRAGVGMGGNDERENTLNQLLVEMDGFASNSGVVVLAGTNRVDTLDPALLRPGRFDRQIVIDPPDIAGRREIFRVHLKPITVEGGEEGVDAVSKAMAALTPGMAGADIANVCNEAALIAARGRKASVSLVDFETAVDRVIGGLEKKNLVMSPVEKKTVAFHEAGHAVAGWFLEHAMPLLKVSIIPRGTAALGYAQYQPMERNLYSKEALLDHMCMTLAGRASEEIFFDTVTSGAADDFSKVTRMAYQSVAEWGLGNTIGKLAYGNSSNGQEDFYSRTQTERRV
jgi:AFG3 family protein